MLRPITTPTSPASRSAICSTFSTSTHKTDVLLGELHGKRQKKQTAHSLRCGPSGGLLWIDQEVVTLRGLFGNSGLLTDLRQADTILTHRKYAGCSFECGPCRF